jgi:hypothetical protein
MADLFSFDVGKYLDDEEEEIISKATSPPTDALKNQHMEIVDWLNASVDALVKNVGPIRSRVDDIQYQLPDELFNVLTPAAYLESHWLRVLRTRQHMANHIKLLSSETILQADRQTA